jgi:diguanylate cyclase (GGDEF)-like protein
MAWSSADNTGLGGDLARAMILVLVYLAFGLAWIYLSDSAVESVTHDPQVMTALQTRKGLGFVSVTGVLLFASSLAAFRQQSRLLREREYQALHNPISELPNRTLAAKRLESELERADHSGERVAVICLDIDRLGDINETFGQAVGDELLKAFGQRLQGLLGGPGWAAHFGDDEYALVMRDADAGALQRRLDHIRAELGRSYELSAIEDVFVSACSGSAVYPRDADRSSVLLRYAEAALARARRTGPDHHVCFEPGIIEHTSRQVQLNTCLRRALADGDLYLVYQPIFSGGDNPEPLAFEALMRCEPAGEAPIPPADFIPAAEQSGLIIALGEWALEAVGRQIAEWRGAGIDLSWVALNLSARQFNESEMIGRVSDLLERHRIPRGRLCIEITESTLMQDSRESEDTLRRLRNLGVRLALDDFGTGFSSLAYLRELPVDILKVDRGFVAELDRAETDRALLEAIISMARIFGLRVVAEGVETDNQRQILEELGCDRFQGFLLGRPLAAADVPGFLAAYSDQ